jgi:hypothetical protein
MLAGMVVIAMPLAIVGNNFSAAWDAHDLWLIGERLKWCMMPQCHDAGAAQQLCAIAHRIARPQHTRGRCSPSCVRSANGAAQWRSTSLTLT